MRPSTWAAIRRAQAAINATPPPMPTTPAERAQPPFRGAHGQDPVATLALPGKLVGTVPCPHKTHYKRKPCGAQALLYRFPDPYGFRAYCEDNHVIIMSPLSIPGLFSDAKLRTD